MAKGFSIMDMMNEISKEDAAVAAEKTERVSVFDIKPNKENFYESSSMEQLKNSIFAMGGVQQNILLAREKTQTVPYRIIAGHRRVRACMELVQEGHPEFEHIPAVIIENIDKDTEKMLLVMTNSTQRELTDWEKVMQHMELKEIIPKLKKRQGIDGRVRTLEADYLGVSEAQIAIYNTIGTRLDEWLMRIFKDGSIGISLAYEAAKLEVEEQRKLVQISMVNGGFTEEDIKKLTGSRTIKGQKSFLESIDKNVSESDTSEETPEPKKENDVSESSTFEKPSESEKENVSDSDTFEETFKEANIAETDCGQVFPKKCVTGWSKYGACNCCGYGGVQCCNQCEKSCNIRCGWIEKPYIPNHNGELEEKPVCTLTERNKNVSESDTSEKTPESEKENVSESSTFEIYPAEQQLKGGYSLNTINNLVWKFDSYLKAAISEKREDQVIKYSCLLDALSLLKERMLH
ncbi:MAG: ParB/RepB/Spo0J family partition protein [Lachnospiraceae bacterium]